MVNVFQYIYYLTLNIIFGCIFCFVVHKVLKKKYRSRVCLIINILMYFIIVSMSIFLYLNIKNLILKNIFVFIIYSVVSNLYMSCFYESVWQKNVLLLFSFYSVYKFIEGICLEISFLLLKWQVIDFNIYYRNRFVNMYLMNFCVFLLMFFVINIISNKLSYISGNLLKGYNFCFLLFPCGLGVCISVFCKFRDEWMFLMAVCVCLFVISLSYLKNLELESKNNYKKFEEYKKVFLKQQNELIKNNIEAKQSIWDEFKKVQYDIKRMSSDFSHHMMAVKVLAEDGDVNGVKNYASQLIGSAFEIERFYETGSGILDVILSEKYTICKEKGINFKAIGNLCKGCVVNPLSLNIIFCNILDNAIENCTKIDDNKKSKFIHTMFFQRPGDENLFIYVENPYYRDLSSQDKCQLQLSSKIESARLEVKKYGGEISERFNEHTHRIEIFIPIHQMEIKQ